MDWFIYELCTVLAGFSIATQNGLGPSLLLLTVPCLYSDPQSIINQKQRQIELVNHSTAEMTKLMIDTTFQLLDQSNKYKKSNTTFWKLPLTTKYNQILGFEKFKKLLFMKAN